MEAVLRKIVKLIQRTQELLALFETFGARMDSAEKSTDHVCHLDRAKA